MTGVMRNVPNTDEAWNWVGIVDGYQDHVGQTTESEENFSEMYHASALPEDQYNGKTVMYGRFMTKGNIQVAGESCLGSNRAL